jgi:filamentous hemagglutinin
LNHPVRVVLVRDTRYEHGGKQVDDPATAYIRSDGTYVVRNDQTGDIVQISDCHDPDWQMPF